MEGRGAGAGDAFPLHNPLHSIAGHMRKRQRSNPGPDTAPHDDVFGGGNWRYSPVSDPDIDYNIQSSKRYLSEVMANNLTRHMSLRPSTSAAVAPPPLPPPHPGPPGSPGDDVLGHALSQPHLPPWPHHPQPHTHTHTPPYSSYGPGPLTPPGGCSPQRTGASEMSDGLADPGGEILQPMITSDASISVSISQGGGGGGGGGGRASAAAFAVDSISETADSELLEERERSVSLSGLLCSSIGAAQTGPVVPLLGSPPPAGTGAPGLPFGHGAGGAGFGGLGLGRALMPPGAGLVAAVGIAGASVLCGGSGGGGGGGTGGSGGLACGSSSPFTSSCGGTPRRLSDTSMGSGGPMGPACSYVNQHHQQALSQQLPLQAHHVMRGTPPYICRGVTTGGRGQLSEVPTSPSDTRFGGLDLRKTALLRSISRRAEETTSDGGGAAVAAIAGFQSGAAAGAAAAPAGGGTAIGCGGGMADSAAGVVTPPGAVAAAAALTRVSPAPRGSGGGGLGRFTASCSDSGLSDGMSEGGGGCGGSGSGAGGGSTGMELSSNSGDGSAGGGGRTGGVAGTSLEEALDEQQHHNQQNPLLALPQAQLNVQDLQFLSAASAFPVAESIAAGSGGVAGGGGSMMGVDALSPAHSCSLGSPPGAAAPQLTGAAAAAQLPIVPGGNRGSVMPRLGPFTLMDSDMKSV